MMQLQMQMLSGKPRDTRAVPEGIDAARDAVTAVRT